MHGPYSNSKNVDLLKKSDAFSTYFYGTPPVAASACIRGMWLCEDKKQWKYESQRQYSRTAKNLKETTILYYTSVLTDTISLFQKILVFH